MAFRQQRPYVEEGYYSESYVQDRPRRPYVEQQEYCGETLYAPPPDYGRERERSSFYEQSAGGGRPHKSEYQRNERLGELGAVAAGAFALYEEHKAKTDPSNATKHKHEAEAAALGALGSTGYSYYEHREKEKFKDDRW